MPIEPYAGLELETYSESAGGETVKVISRGGLDHFLSASTSVQRGLTAVPITERLAILEKVGVEFEADLQAGKLELSVDELSISTGYSERLIRGELAFIPSVLSSANLLKCLKGSLIGAPSSLNGFTDIGNGEWIWHLPAGPSLIVSSGNSIIPTIVPTALSLVTGNSTILKPSLSNCIGVVEVFRNLDQLPASEARDAMREALVISYFQHDSPVLRFALREAKIGVINFWGGGQARAAIKRMVEENPNRPRFHVNGPMTGAAVIDAGAASEQNATGLALNIALYNQQLCSSPTVVTFIGKTDQAAMFADSVGKALDDIGPEMPMDSNDLDPYSLHGARRYLQIKGSQVLSSKDEANPWTIVISGGRSNLDGMVDRFPGMSFYGRKRFVEIISVDSMKDGLDIIAGLPRCKAFEGIDKVQTVGVALSPGNLESAPRELALAGIFRIVPIMGMFMRSAFEPYDGLGFPSLFTYTSYMRKDDSFAGSEIDRLFQM